MIVLNRTSKQNLEVPLSSALQMQVREPYLIFRLDQNVDDQKIRGIWFHNGREREEVKAVLDRVVKSLSDTATINQGENASSNDNEQVGKTTSKASAAASLLSTLTEGDKSNIETHQVNSSNSTIDNKTVALSKKDLQLSLMSLIQDDRFLDVLHAQYLKVLRARETQNVNDSSNS